MNAVAAIKESLYKGRGDSHIANPEGVTFRGTVSCDESKERSEHQDVEGASITGTTGAPSREGCMLSD